MLSAVFYRERDLERGQSPLSLKLPSPARRTLIPLIIRLERGYRGEVSTATKCK
jgi:hypothetical protein